MPSHWYALRSKPRKEDIVWKQEIYDVSPSIFVDGALASSPAKNSIPAIRSLVLEVDRLTKAIRRHGGYALQFPRTRAWVLQAAPVAPPSFSSTRSYSLPPWSLNKTIHRVQSPVQSSTGVTEREDLQRNVAAANP